MRLSIHSRQLAVGGAARERIERRLGFALGRFGDRIGRVAAVRLADVNGPRGGVDKRCRVVAELPGHAAVVVEEADADLNALIDRAADRLGEAVRRRLDRARLYAGPTPPAVGGPDVDAQEPPGEDEAERLRQLVLARFGGRVWDFRVLVRGGGLVLQGRTGNFHLKQMVQETVVGATALRLVGNEITVELIPPWRGSAGPPPRSS